MRHESTATESPDLLDIVGTGGSSTVWRAWYRGRVVAVKQSPRGDAGAAGLEREARLASAVRHPHVLRPLASLATEQGPLLVLPYAAGGSLADRLQRCGALAPSEAVRLGRQIADGLTAVHAAGLVHRDVKPGNVLVDGEGDALLADFGVAVTVDEAAGGAAPPEGSPAYVATELLAGTPASARSDVFSLGATLFELLTGRLPATTGRPDAPTLRTLVPGLPDELATLVEACLSLDPAQRPASAGVVRDALAALAPAVNDWEPDADAALAAWAPTEDPRTTRSFGPRPPAVPEPAETRPAPPPWAVALAAVATFATPVAAALALG